MRRSVCRLLAAMLVGFGAVLVPAGRSVAEPDPARVCAVSDQLIKAGYLTEARALFNRLPDEAPVPCMAADLQRIDLRKAAAAAAVRKGQQQLAEKKNEAAAKSFEAALAEERDNAEARAGHTAATAEKAPSKGLSEEKEDWDDFYHDWLVPLLQLIAAALIGIVVLGALSGLFAHWVVRPQSVVWHRAARSVIGTLGVVLILGCGVMMPLYAMYRPFAPQTVVADPAGLAFLIPALAVLIAVAQAAATSPTRLMRPQSWAPWWRLLLATAAVIGAGLLAWLTVMSDPLERLLVAYAVLSCFGVVLTAVALGQNLRLQVEAQKTEGTADAVATDYLLARLRALGTERPPQGLTAVPAVTSLSSLRTEDLSALPAGKVAGALSRLFFALRPDLTWRARVVLVDANRIAVTLTRNGHHAESTIFSRLDLGLPMATWWCVPRTYGSIWDTATGRRKHRAPRALRRPRRRPCRPRRRLLRRPRRRLFRRGRHHRLRPRRFPSRCRRDRPRSRHRKPLQHPRHPRHPTPSGHHQRPRRRPSPPPLRHKRPRGSGGSRARTTRAVRPVPRRPNSR
ncbi:hypothetical protein STANM309S_03531 [Streptomyces tanashiensis]